jgi:Cupin domain
MAISFPRTYADPDGRSHFADVEDAIPLTAFVPTNPPLGLSLPRPATTAVFCRLSPGWDGFWHPTPRRQFAVTLSGEWEIAVTDGERRRFGPGDAVLLDDRARRGHHTLVIGADDVLILLVWLEGGGEDGDGGMDREEATQP